MMNKDVYNRCCDTNMVARDGSPLTGSGDGERSGVPRRHAYSYFHKTQNVLDSLENVYIKVDYSCTKMLIIVICCVLTV